MFRIFWQVGIGEIGKKDYQNAEKIKKKQIVNNGIFEEFWIFKCLYISEKYSMIFQNSLIKSLIEREILPLLCDHHSCKAFQIKKPPRTWIFESSLKWGSCYFGSGPKLSLVHLIFILCNLFCVEAFCYLLWFCWIAICLLFSVTRFVIELVQ